DVDGDGIPDVVVGGERAIHLVSGRSGATVARLEGAWSKVPVAIVPDVDGDRLADVVVGSGAGWASVRTSPGLERALELFGPPSPLDGRSTWALAAGGAADGDGRADVLVSASTAASRGSPVARAIRSS